MARSKSKPTLKSPGRKISATFLQFAEPLLDAVGPNPTEAEMEQPLRIAWTVWNSVVYADVGNDDRTLKSLRASIGHDFRVEACVEALIHRKRIAFANDCVLIGEYTLFRKDGQIHLRAEARDPCTKVQKDSTDVPQESQ